MVTSYSLEVLGHVRSPFKDKFGLPRQPGLIKSARAQIEITRAFSDPQAFEALSTYSHIWLSFIFHQCADKHWKPQVRPPRLGGNKRVGVFASRSPFRPNSLGLSVVELYGLRFTNQRMLLDIACPDLVDGTPIVDIKPYLPYADAIESAQTGYAPSAPASRLSVIFSPQAQAQLTASPITQLKELIEETISFDPRPAYKAQANATDNKRYKLRLYNYEVIFSVVMEEAIIEAVNVFDERHSINIKD